MGHFHLWGLIKALIWTYMITCKLDFTKTRHSNNNDLLVGPQHRWQRKDDGYVTNQLEDCKWRLTFHCANTQQCCGWDIAYKRLGPPGTIHIMGYLQEPRRQRTQNMHNHIRRFTLRARRPYRGPILNRQWRACCDTSLGHGVFPFSICITEDFPRSNAVHTLPWPAYTPYNLPSSISEGHHWLPDKVTWPTPRNHGAFMPGNPGSLGHPTGKNYSSESCFRRVMRWLG